MNRISEQIFRVNIEAQGGWRSVAWSPDGSLLVGGMEGGRVYIMNFAAGTFVQELSYHDTYVYALAWSPDGTKLASSDAKGEIIIWDVQSSEGYPIDTQNINVSSAAIDWTATTGLVFGYNENVIGFGSNTSPTANAGADQNISLANSTDSITLDASASSDDVVIVDYIWTDALGTQLGKEIAPTVHLPIGEHTITLTVTDDDGATATDEVIITVK